MSHLLDVEDLAVEFRTARGRLRAVDGVSFHVDPGETLAIVGESGSGKSVTALSLLRLLGDAGRVQAGRTRFEGVELASLSNAGIRALRGNRIAMIFQEPMSSLNPVLTIGEQVAEPLRLHKGMNRREARAAAGDLLGQGLHPRRPRAPGRLPPPVLRRHAPAGDDRHGHRLPARR
jgi:oligopeptide transport system ATP-binding protein